MKFITSKDDNTNRFLFIQIKESFEYWFNKGALYLKLNEMRIDVSYPKESKSYEEDFETFFKKKIETFLNSGTENVFDLNKVIDHYANYEFECTVLNA